MILKAQSCQISTNIEYNLLENFRFEYVLKDVYTSTNFEI